MDSTPQTALLESALFYAARGWPVFPCHTPTPTGCSCLDPACTSIGKHPRTQHGLRDATTDTALIQRWWKRWPQANVAIATGATSGVVVLDEDSYKGGDGSRHDLEQTYRPLPDTVQQLTGGGGVQFFFVHPGTPVKNSVRHLGPGLDMRGDGGYVIAPPSLHASGKRYVWEVSHDPEDTAVAPFPDWLQALCQEGTPAQNGEHLDVGAPIVDGARNDTLFKTGCSMRGRGFAGEVILAALRAMNQTQCVPPLPDEDVQTIAASCTKYEAGVPPDHPVPKFSPPFDDAQAVSALLDSLRFPFVDTAPDIPSLPPRAHCPVSQRTTWLDHYAAHSAYWSNRSAPTYHKAVGLWILSTIAGRRIVAQMGSTPVYPTLFLALVSESTHWTKTTAAEIGKRLLKRAGCEHLLAPARTTPQFLLKLMSGLAPQNYGTLSEDEQAVARETFGFAAQRGWFYEEWGGMLTQMRRVDSPHAELNKLLIVLEGGADTFETGTIQRGLERIDAPYLALLGNATPHDMAPFMGEGNPWWHDGFWPRFACVTPPYGAKPSRAPRPREAYHLPSDLITPLYEWHRRLGSPLVTIQEEREANGKLTGRWEGTGSPMPCQHMTLTAEVYDAYETYNDALLEMIHAGNVQPDLSAWYGRAHEKALRVAMLLSSICGETVITRDSWSEGQAMAESWRKNLHEVLATIRTAAPLSREAQLEARIESLCAKTGGLTAREVQQHVKGQSSEVIQKAIAAMVKIGTLSQHQSGKRVFYCIAIDAEVIGEQMGNSTHQSVDL